MFETIRAKAAYSYFKILGSCVYSRQSGMLIYDYIDSRVYSRQSGILIYDYIGSRVYSLQSGILMHLGPPRPRESSAEGISCTVTPCSRRMPLVT